MEGMGISFFYGSTFLKLMVFSYDLVYIQYASHSSPPVLWARRFRPIRIYTNVHGSDVLPSTGNQKRFRKYTDKILGISEKIIVPSLYFRQVVRKKYGVPADKIIVYPSGGVDQTVFYPLRTEQRTDARKNIIWTGIRLRLCMPAGW